MTTQRWCRLQRRKRLMVMNWTVLWMNWIEGATNEFRGFGKELFLLEYDSQKAVKLGIKWFLNGSGIKKSALCW